jgi:hypothetical protein
MKPSLLLEIDECKVSYLKHAIYASSLRQIKVRRVSLADSKYELEELRRTIGAGDKKGWKTLGHVLCWMCGCVLHLSECDATRRVTMISISYDFLYSIRCHGNQPDRIMSVATDLLSHLLLSTHQMRVRQAQRRGQIGKGEWYAEDIHRRITQLVREGFMPPWKSEQELRVPDPCSQWRRDCE